MKMWTKPELASIEINQTMGGGFKYVPEFFVPDAVDLCHGIVYGHLSHTGPDPVPDPVPEDPGRGKPETSDPGDPNLFS